MAKGIKSSGKAAYVFAILPYIILLIILSVALNLNGAWEGIKYFLVPDSKDSISVFQRLFDLKIW
jgi:SNF family Na+-dependent transporter